MAITANHTTAARRIGVLVFMGVAAALVLLGRPGTLQRSRPRPAPSCE